MQYTYLIIWVIGVVFGAGIGSATVAAMRKDVNGIGNVVRRDRWNRTLAQMVLLDSREDREQLARMLKE